jgi:hypothetical protein
MGAAVAGTTSFRPAPSYTTLRDVTALPEIRDLFVAGTRGNERLRELARARAALVEGEIARLRNVRSWLTQASDCGCEDLGDCELFAASTCAP